MASVSPSPPAAPRQPPRCCHEVTTKQQARQVSNIPKTVHLCKGCLNLAHRSSSSSSSAAAADGAEVEEEGAAAVALVAAAPQPKRCRSKSGVPDRYSGLDAAPHPVPDTAPHPVLDTAPHHAAPHPVPATAPRLQAPETALHRAPRPNSQRPATAPRQTVPATAPRQTAPATAPRPDSPRARGDMRPPPRSPQRGRARARTLPAPSLASSGAAHAPVGRGRRAEHLHAAGGAPSRRRARLARAQSRCMHVVIRGHQWVVSGCAHPIAVHASKHAEPELLRQVAAIAHGLATARE